VVAIKGAISVETSMDVSSLCYETIKSSNKMIYRNLVGMAVHSGRLAYSGHYISVVRVAADSYRRIDDMDLLYDEPTLTSEGVSLSTKADFNVGCGLCVFE